MSTAKRKSSPAQSSDGADLTLVVFNSEMGWMAAQFIGSALAQLSFGHRTREQALESLPGPVQRTLNPKIARTIERLQAYAAGYEDDLSDVEVKLATTTPFQLRVLEACIAIPRGETLTYGQLAIIAGAPGAARAVGSVMRKNKLPLVVPCHRVVASGGALGGYSGPEGTRRKLRLLEREGAWMK